MAASVMLTRYYCFHSANLKRLKYHKSIECLYGIRFTRVPEEMILINVQRRFRELKITLDFSEDFPRFSHIKSRSYCDFVSFCIPVSCAHVTKMCIRYQIMKFNMKKLTSVKIH